ncbi:MAG TPA: hypothetical protein VL854_02955 [Nitrososphaeraceae archaeon]|nr:hypothetical protein [Nitrososphaeraceae archaeon]
MSTIEVKEQPSKVEKFFDVKTVAFIAAIIITNAVTLGIAKNKLDTTGERLTKVEEKLSNLNTVDLQSGIQRAEFKVELSSVHGEISALQNRVSEIDRRTIDNKSEINVIKGKLDK